MQSWAGTGIIARIEKPGVARAILDSGLPAIALDLAEEQLRPDHPLARLSEVASDSRGPARLAAEHLLERGFRHYAFVGSFGRVWSDRRQQSFCARIREAGFQPHVYDPPRARRDRVWEREQTILARWLGELPRPIGLMSCDDDRGPEVLEACRAGGLQVPEEVAVVGVDNDELLCELADPPLSSVALNAERKAYRKAVLVHTPVHASWLNQVEIHFSIIQRKVLTPNDFASLEEVEQRLRLYEELSNREPRPFQWKFDRAALRTFLEKLHAKRELLSSASVG